MLNDRGLGEKGRVSHLPATDTQQEANHIRLLLLLNLFHVFEGTHLENIKNIQLLALVLVASQFNCSWARFSLLHSKCREKQSVHFQQHRNSA